MNQTPVASMDPQPISGWQALVRILTDPVQTFRQLGDRPAIWPPYLLQMGASIVALILSLPVLMQQIQEQLDKMPSMQASPISPETTMQMGLVSGAIGALVAPWISGLITSLVAMFFGQFQGGRGTFSGYFGMVGYAMVPTALVAILGGLWVRLTGAQLDLSPAALLTSEAGLTLKAALTQFSVPSVWHYALLAIGFAHLNRKPVRAGITFAGVLFLVSMLFTVGAASLSGSLTGGLQ